MKALLLAALFVASLSTSFANENAQDNNAELSPAVQALVNSGVESSELKVTSDEDKL